MDVVHQFNWGRFLLDRLVREVSRFRQGKQRAVGGCLLFLQLFYYESVAVEGLFDAVPVVLPYLFSWGKEEIAEREKRERELGGYGFGEVICKVRGLGMGMLGHVDGLLSGDVATAIDHSHLCALEWKKEIVRMNPKDGNVVHGDIEVVDSVRAPCQNTESGCREIVNYLKENDRVEPCTDVPCACPLRDCNFTGLLEHLSLHFSSKHWDSGRRFKYNSPLTVSLGMNETFLVLQAEEDGLLFILNRGTENVGHTITITCIGPRWSTEHFLYELSYMSLYQNKEPAP